MPEYYVAWWNVENLFDVEDSTDRPDWLQNELARELEGWTDEVVDKKVAQLASVITRMNDANGPDLLGVCEVENEPVLERLARAKDRNQVPRRSPFHAGQQAVGFNLSGCRALTLAEGAHVESA